MLRHSDRLGRAACTPPCRLLRALNTPPGREEACAVRASTRAGDSRREPLCQRTRTAREGTGRGCRATGGGSRGRPIDHAAFGLSGTVASVRPDTPAALQYLISATTSSYSSRTSIVRARRQQPKPESPSTPICTAQDIARTKPTAQFRYLTSTRWRGLGVARSVLHTARGLYHDHATAKALGLAAAWIDRRHERSGWSRDGCHRPRTTA